jgi:hypothetical protein
MLIKSLATTSVAVLLIAPLAANADKPTPVTVVNPVVPVEISNSDPIPVSVSGPSAADPGHDYRALIPPELVVVLSGSLAASDRLEIGTVVATNPETSSGTESIQIQARRWVNGACVGTPTIYDSIIPVLVPPGQTVSIAYPIPLEFPGSAPDGEWCLAAAASVRYMHVSVVAR